MKAEDIAKLSSEQIEDLVVEGQDIQTLYRIDIYLEKLKSKLYRDINNEMIEKKRLEKKSELSWAENLMRISRSRQHDIQEGQAKFNWFFRIEAQKQLEPEIYNRIADRAKYGLNA